MGMCLGRRDGMVVAAVASRMNEFGDLLGKYSPAPLAL